MSAVPEIEGVTGLIEIGRGGFGVVYRGTEIEFGRTVAVKVLPPILDERSRKRFERERRAMGATSHHPNIVTVYRGGVTPTNQPYLVMEYLPGGSLSDRLQTTGPLGWNAAAVIGVKLAHALAAAHRAGILHRDVKPGNVFLTNDGEPMLGDFGIARLDDGHETRTGSITASVAHAPPEIVSGETGDERSDIYSLASTIYALTLGAAPFARTADQGLAGMLAQITTSPPPPLYLEPAATQFEAVLMQALSKQPADRHDTIAAFGTQLERSIISPEVSHPALVNAAAAAPVESAELAVDVTAPNRPVGAGQLAFFAVLALVIAGFGGWAVSRAVVAAGGEDSTATSATSVPTQVPEPPPPAPPTAEPTAAPTATEIPEPTAVPTAAPTPAPTASAGGGNRGSGLGTPAEISFVTVTDFSGAITVEAPNAWAIETWNGTEVDLVDGTRALSVGASPSELGGDPEFRDLSQSGIYVFAVRLDGPGELITSEILRVGTSFWSDCVFGEENQIRLIDGLAQYQILECVNPDGPPAGVVVMGLVPDDDPTIAVSITMQFSDMADLAILPTLVTSLDIDPTQF